MKFKLELTEQEVNTILTGLGELAAKHSIDLIAKIKSTCESQIEHEVETLETE
tara:strand:+ start:2879 stop:3037 length:159 start_codon:yes stop_codon:yes gene_type:complete